MHSIDALGVASLITCPAFSSATIPAIISSIIISCPGASAR